MKKITILLFAVLAFNSCNLMDMGPQTVSVDNKYSLAMPSFLTKTDNLNSDASLQYENRLKEFYVIVIDESKAEMQKALDDNNLNGTYKNDVNGYTDLAIGVFDQSLQIQNKSQIIKATIANLPARILTINGRLQEIDIFYTIAFVEGKDRYYQIMTWTLAGKQNEYKDQMNKIIYSFKEIK